MNLKIHFSGGAPLGVPHLSRMTIFLSLHHSVTGHLYKSAQPRCLTGPSNFNATKNWTPNLLHSLPVLLENAMLAISGVLTITYAVCQWLRMIVLSKCIVWSGLHANFTGTVFVQAGYVVLACIGQRASVVFLSSYPVVTSPKGRQNQPSKGQSAMSMSLTLHKGLFTLNHHHTVLQRTACQPLAQMSQ